MKNRYLVSCVVLALAALAATAFLYHRLPAQVPLHWNANGEVDRYGERAWIFLHPALMLALTALWAVLPAVSPHRFTVDAFRQTWWFTGLVVVALLAWLQGVILWSMLAGAVDIQRALFGGIAVFITLIGNVMGKVRRNFWLGIRTPWTLADERVWYATHRLAGKSMVAGGLLALAVVLTGLPVDIAVALVLAAALIPAAWSLVYYKRLDRGGGLGA